jgi:N-acetylneuraminic acid mutarotase
VNGPYLYVGGRNPTTGYSAFFRRYDTATDAWVTLPAMSVSRDSAAIVVLNGMVHYLGGVVAFGTFSDAHEVYDIGANTWTTRAPLPAQLAYLGAAAIDGKIYVAGGGTQAGTVTTLYRYDPATNLWTTLAPIPVARRGPVVAVNGKLVAVGGQDSGFGGTEAQMRRIFAYDPATNTWTEAAPLPYGRSSHVVEAIEDRVFVVSGLAPLPTERVDSFILQRVLDTTDHWVRIRNYSPFSTGSSTSYSVRLTSLGSGAPDVHEPDNTPATAKSLTYELPHTGASNHTLHQAGDEDWVYYDATAGTKCYFETYQVGPAADTEMWLYDPSGHTVLKYDDDGGGQLASQMSYAFPSTARYLFRIRKNGQQTGGVDHQYSLRVRCNVDDAFEPDNTAAQATLLTVDSGTTQSHIISEPGDEDWNRFNVIAGNRYFVQTFNNEGNDTYLYLIGPDGTTVLAENDDHFSTAQSLIRFSPATTGTYYAKVRHNRHPYTFGPDTGFRIWVLTDTLPPDPPVQVSVVSGDGSGRVQLRVRPLVAADALKV